MVLLVDVVFWQIMYKFIIRSYNGLIVKELVYIFIGFIIEVVFMGIEDVFVNGVDLLGFVGLVFQFVVNENKVSKRLGSVE